MRKVKTTNPELVKLIRFLRKQSNENEVAIWKDIAERLVKPRSNRPTVNLSRLNRYTHEDEVVVVPGKVLSTGEISHPITVAALAFSEKAKEKIYASKGKCLSFAELVKNHPKGSNIKIIG